MVPVTALIANTSFQMPLGLLFGSESDYPLPTPSLATTCGPCPQTKLWLWTPLQTLPSPDRQPAHPQCPEGTCRPREGNPRGEGWATGGAQGHADKAGMKSTLAISGHRTYTAVPCAGSASDGTRRAPRWAALVKWPGLCLQHVVHSGRPDNTALASHDWQAPGCDPLGFISGNNPIPRDMTPQDTEVFSLPRNWSGKGMMASTPK